MSICDAVNDVVETRFRQSNPRSVIEYFIIYILRRCRNGNGKHNAKWQPEQDECEEAVKITSHQRKVRFVHCTRLEAWLAHEFFRINYNANVNEECN